MFSIVAKNYRKMQKRSAAQKRKQVKATRYVAALVCGVCVAALSTSAMARSHKAPAAAEAPQMPIACGAVYTVGSGDTLFKIAVRAYDDGHQYKRIFKANRKILRRPTTVEIGHELFIPCLDGSGPRNRREALALHQAAMAAPYDQAVMHDRLPAGDPALPADSLAAPGLPADPPLAAGAAMPRAAIEPAGIEPAVAGNPLAGQVLAEAAPFAVPAEAPAAPAEVAEAAPTIVAAADPVVAAPVIAAPVVDPVVTAAAAAAPAITDEHVPAPTLRTAARRPAQALAPTPIRAVTGVLASPSTDRGATEIGLVERLLTRSIRQAAPGQTLQVAYVGDWETHLTSLLPSGRRDIGFPWVRPDCGNPKLGSEARMLCDRFVFSNPLIEVEIASYARAGDPIVKAAARPDLSTRKICLPANHHAFAVSELDADDEVVTAESADACFAWLLLKKVDVVMLVRREAEQAIALYRLDSRVQEITSMAARRTLHAIMPRQRQQGDDYMRLINAGLDELMKSGEWFRALSSYQSTMLASAN